jgi:hypothetical protein
MKPGGRSVGFGDADHGISVNGGGIAGQEWITGLRRMYGSGNGESSAEVRGTHEGMRGESKTLNRIMDHPNLIGFSMVGGDTFFIRRSSNPSLPHKKRVTSSASVASFGRT